VSRTRANAHARSARATPCRKLIKIEMARRPARRGDYGVVFGNLLRAEPVEIRDDISLVGPGNAFF